MTLISRIWNLGLKTKLLLIYFLTIFLPLALIGQVITGISGNKVIEQSIALNRAAAGQTMENITNLINQNLSMVNRICYDTRLQQYLDIYSHYSGEDNWVTYLNYLNPLSTYVNNLTQSKMRIYYLNESLIPDNRTYFFAEPKIRSSHFFRHVQKAGSSMYWYPEREGLSLGKTMNGPNFELLAVVSVQIPEEVIHSYMKLSRTEEKTILLCDKNGSVLSSNNQELTGTSIASKAYFTAVQQGRKDAFEYHEDGTFKVLYQSMKNDSELPDLLLITLIPVDRLLEESSRIRNVGMGISVVSLLLSTAAFVILLNRITRRIRKLVDKMQGVKAGSFERVEEYGAHDEIGMIMATFNQMVDSLKKLIYENYETKLQMKDIRIKKREAELYALQSQINPHFLFNTLESIRLSLYGTDIDRIALVILNFSKVMRKSLNWSGDIIPLQEELDFVKSYLEIQQFRFYDKIAFELHVESGLQDWPIPKFILQPFVENAIVHGLEKNWGGGCVVISAERVEDFLVLTVSDNGLGMEAAVLEKLRCDLDSGEEVKKSGSIGMKNVNDRLKLYYGREFGIKIESEARRGTTVTVRIPAAIKKEQEE